MFRRAVQIVILASGIALLGVMATSQWVGCAINAGRARAVIHPASIRLVWGPDSAWNVTAHDETILRQGYFAWPRYQVDGAVKFVILPWWSVWVAWVPLAVVGWMLMRRKREPADRAAPQPRHDG